MPPQYLTYMTCSVFTLWLPENTCYMIQAGTLHMEWNSQVYSSAFNTFSSWMYIAECKYAWFSIFTDFTSFSFKFQSWSPFREIKSCNSIKTLHPIQLNLQHIYAYLSNAQVEQTILNMTFWRNFCLDFSKESKIILNLWAENHFLSNQHGTQSFYKIVAAWDLLGSAKCAREWPWKYINIFILFELLLHLHSMKCLKHNYSGTARILTVLAFHSLRLQSEKHWKTQVSLRKITLTFQEDVNWVSTRWRDRGLQEHSDTHQCFRIVPHSPGSLGGLASSVGCKVKDYHWGLCICVSEEKRGNWRHPANILNACMLTPLEESSVNELLRSGLQDIIVVTPQAEKLTLRGNFFKLGGDIIKWSFAGCTGTERVSSNHLSSNNQMCWTQAGYCKHNYSVIG